jgi:hypothetical protein
MEPCVLGLVDYTHPSASQLLKDAVVRNRKPEERIGFCHGLVTEADTLTGQ